MPRKYFRKYLPSHESVKRSRFIGLFGSLLHHPNLWHLNRHSVAGGVAVGMFTGLIPGSNPVQFAAAAILSVIFHVNLPVAMITTFYTNPFTIVPLYLAAYKIGRLFTGHNADNIPQAEFTLANRPVTEWFPAFIDWLTALGKPLLIGLPVLALLLAVISYFVVRAAWRWHVVYEWRKRQRRRGQKHT